MSIQENGFPFCTGNACTRVHNATETKLTSLIDLKYSSFYHSYNFLSFVQLGLEDGFTRYLPYTSIPTYYNNPSDPSSCQIFWPSSNPICREKYQNSDCSKNGWLSSPSYPSYDVRCRSWYANGTALSARTESVFFQEPRSSSSGEFVQTAYIPLRARGAFLGVLSSNYLGSHLSDVINSLRILTSGYCYLIDSDSSALISHPSQSASCDTVRCAENFDSSAEYDAFVRAVLDPIHEHGSLSSSSVTYTKRAEKWRLTAYPVRFGTVAYTILATVPNSEVEKTSTDTNKSIRRTVNAMVVAFALAIAGFMVVLFLFAWWMVRSIVDPVNDLREVFALVRNDVLTSSIPSSASSRDMKVLLEAFSKVTLLPL